MNEPGRSTRTAAAVRLEPGVPQPFGANWTGQGTNFAIYSANATRVELCLFDGSGREERARLRLPGRTGEIWHGFLPAEFAGPGTLYGYRVHGPYAPREGHRFNPAKLLIDPAALALDGRLLWHPALRGASEHDDGVPDGQDSAPFVPKARIVEDSFDWRDSRAPNVPWRDTVIYELHVKGFTQLHPDVPIRHRGKYLGLIEPPVIDYLKRLGVTTLELMPCQAFFSEEFLIRKGLANYWGYNPIAWYAPAAEYAVQDAVTEFKTMVRGLHEAGFEVILDVVFNHTAEGNEHGPTLSMRGVDNASHYQLVPQRRECYENISGCGNTVAIYDPATRALVLDCLRYWASDMHVDGFRFDLAPVLGRDRGGFSRHAPFFSALQSDPVLSNLKLIAEPWDIGPGGYQLGNFPNGWSEWNDRYRDTVRAFWRGDGGLLGAFAERFAGSSDLFRGHGRKPTASINYVSAHDGFTLHDLVAYGRRHNEANLENNSDGHHDNLSWNCGVEGPTEDSGVLELRRRQMRNLLATLFLSQGVPMLQGGDEFARTQRGNNNAYCQDNPISWVDWSLREANAALVDFTRSLVDLRRSRLWLRRDTFLKGARGTRASRDVTWLHPAGHQLSEHDWNDVNLRCIGVMMSVATGDSGGELLLIVNNGDDRTEFHLPGLGEGCAWHRRIDTSRVEAPTPLDVLHCNEDLPIGSRSLLLLESASTAPT